MSAWLANESGPSFAVAVLTLGLAILHQVEAPKVEAPELQLPSLDAAKPEKAAPAKPPGANWLEGFGIDSSSLTQASALGSHRPCNEKTSVSLCISKSTRDVPHHDVLLRGLIEGPGHQLSQFRSGRPCAARKTGRGSRLDVPAALPRPPGDLHLPFGQW